MKKLATISIKDIAIDCIIGCLEQERHQKQPVFVSLTYTLDVTQPSITDNIADAVSYATLYEKIIQRVSESQFHLLEALASDIVHMVLEDTRIIQATVAITKPQVLPQSKGVTLEMTASNIV